VSYVQNVRRAPGRLLLWRDEDIQPGYPLKIRVADGAGHAILRVLESEMNASQETLATKVDLMELRTELHGIESKLSRWVLTCILGQTAVPAGLGYFFLAHIGRQGGSGECIVGR